jgi:hypothetical protein
MRSLWVAALLVTLWGALAPRAEAQGRRRGRPGLRAVMPPELGPRVGYDFRVDDWSVGGQFRVPGSRLETLLSGDVYFAGTPRPWQLNLDLAFHLRPGGTLYFGGGVGIYHVVTTDVAPNLLLGLKPGPRRRFSPIRPYAEGRCTFLDGGTPFRLVFGVNVAIGR